jgi:aspartate oxidase
VQNLLTVGHLMTRAALEREETRGTHARSDAPGERPGAPVRYVWNVAREGAEEVPAATAAGAAR